MVLDDHTLSETLFLALTDLSCATQMWHVLVGTQVWSKQKAYFSLLLIYSKVQRTQTHLGPLPTSSPGPLLSALTQFSPFPLSSQTTSCDRVLSHASRSERVWETCLCCRPHTALAIWVSDYWTSSRNSSTGTYTHAVKNQEGIRELLMVHLTNRGDSSLSLQRQYRGDSGGFIRYSMFPVVVKGISQNQTINEYFRSLFTIQCNL